MTYENYKLEDFLFDLEFKNWVLAPTEDSQLFWEQWIKGHPEQLETILTAKEIILTLEYQEPKSVSIEEQNELLKGILIHKPERSSAKTKFGYYSIAASILILLAASFYYFHFIKTDATDTPSLITQVVKENPRGQKTKIALPDGSVAWLNSDSRIEYSSDFTGERNIHLRGEAYFEVVKNPEKPFKVYSGDVVTTALGTSFNVQAFENHHIKIGLVTGKISVSVDQSDMEPRTVDSPGQTVLYNKEVNELTLSFSKELDFFKWTEKTIVFEDANIAEVKEVLERWYNVDITIKNLNRKIMYTGEYKNESLERILQRMSFVEKFSYEIKGKEVEINFK
ncbi:FecR family protein [Fulvivirgaceae bacterium BMA10]|uniref:FecR family protein n=1 Tax=Splendidivirga corallicola TaxID=3051826 RepID=A0ABT8KTV0_9BACT|nr:FecR family protein [Fulvivirgaceae bacterium BMA10]